MSKPFISIIVPTLNNEEFLPTIIKSLEIQEYRNFEVLFIDGLSTDKSFEMIQEYISRSKDVKVSIYSEKASGVSRAFNIGVKKSKGKYLVFLGTDDYLTDKYSLLKAEMILQKTNPDMLHGEAIKDYFGVYTRPHFTKYSTTGYLLNLTYRMPISHQNTFFKRGVFDRVGLYDERLKSSMDFDIIHGVLRNGMKVVITNANFAVFKHRLEALSKKNGIEHIITDPIRFFVRYRVIPFVSFPYLCYLYKSQISYYLFEEEEYIDRNAKVNKALNVPF